MKKENKLVSVIGIIWFSLSLGWLASSIIKGETPFFAFALAFLVGNTLNDAWESFVSLLPNKEDVYTDYSLIYKDDDGSSYWVRFQKETKHQYKFKFEVIETNKGKEFLFSGKCDLGVITYSFYNSRLRKIELINLVNDKILEYQSSGLATSEGD